MLEFLKKIIRDAGEITLRYKGDPALKIQAKSAKDLVTQIDVEVENYLVSNINKTYPQHAILGEESGETEGNEYRWIIDPIDGTTSFIHGQPFYSISIALERHGEPILAAVYAPALNELFYAQKGLGAFLNDQKITVSPTDDLVQSCVGTGFACLRSNLEYNNLPFFNAIAQRVRGVRRFGSAAVDMCYVACGKMDAFWEINLKIYDIAAGKFILEQAGGKVTDFHNKPLVSPFEVLATNGAIHEKMVEILTDVKNEFYAE